MANETRRDLDRLDDEISRGIGESVGAVREEVTRRIQGRLIADLRPVTPLASPLVYFLGLFGVLAIFASALIPTMGTAGAAKMTGVQTAAMSVVFVAGGILFAFLLTRQFAPALPQPIGTRLAVSLFCLVALVGTGVLFPWREPGTEWTESWQCLTRVIAFAAVAAFVLAVPMRRAAVLSPSGRGATVGAAAGLAGVAIQQFACTHQQGFHLLLWHWSGIAIATCAGALIGHLSGRISSQRA